MPNSKDIILNIVEKSRINESKAKEILDTIAEYLTQVLLQNSSVTITGFGTFTPKNKKIKVKSGEETETVEQITVDFKIGDTLGKRLNKNGNL